VTCDGNQNRRGQFPDRRVIRLTAGLIFAVPGVSLHSGLHLVSAARRFFRRRENVTTGNRIRCSTPSPQPLVLPDGQITLRLGPALRVKIFLFSRTPNQRYNRRRLIPAESNYAEK
jgi:hypothetical protein